MSESTRAHGWWLALLVPLVACKEPAHSDGVDLAKVGQAGHGETPTPEPMPDPETKAPADVGRPAPPAIGPLQKAKIDVACVEAQSLRSAVEMYQVSQGKCPAALGDLKREGFVAEERDDPWGNPYRLTCPELELRSAGPDGELDTADDVFVGESGSCEGA